MVFVANKISSDVEILTKKILFQLPHTVLN